MESRIQPEFMLADTVPTQQQLIELGKIMIHSASLRDTLKVSAGATISEHVQRDFLTEPYTKSTGERLKACRIVTGTFAVTAVEEAIPVAWRSKITDTNWMQQGADLAAWRTTHEFAWEGVNVVLAKRTLHLVGINQSTLETSIVDNLADFKVDSELETLFAESEMGRVTASDVMVLTEDLRDFYDQLDEDYQKKIAALQ